ncbi:MAG: alpha/beta fold hydrolase [Paracoccaceae bacterium]
MKYEFADCLLDTERHEFRVGGHGLDLEPQVFDLLHLLARRPGELVSRDELIAEVWDGRIVSESTIAARINAARRAVGDDGKAQRVIRTVPRRGIRLVAEVTTGGGTAPATPDDPAANQHVRFATSSDGSSVAFATTGRGPDLLRAGHWLTHLELDWHSPVWRPLLDALGQRFTVTRYDQRGTGLSDWNVENFELENFVDDLEAVADAAGLRKFPIFASSQGVPTAIAFAARHPERVSRLILYGGFATGRRLRSSTDEIARSEAFLTLIREG